MVREQTAVRPGAYKHTNTSWVRTRLTFGLMDLRCSKILPHVFFWLFRPKDAQITPALYLAIPSAGTRCKPMSQPVSQPVSPVGTSFTQVAAFTVDSLRGYGLGRLSTYSAEIVSSCMLRQVLRSLFSVRVCPISRPVCCASFARKRCSSIGRVDFVLSCKVRQPPHRRASRTGWRLHAGTDLSLHHLLEQVTWLDSSSSLS
mmetsp:Transcript_57913/g.93755  ORF Transcript_57913/g.93755 Transcript_57913/m.93755 type:complete len:202 (-) Transcript_57913:100-705(-)